MADTPALDTLRDLTGAPVPADVPADALAPLDEADDAVAYPVITEALTVAMEEVKKKKKKKKKAKKEAEPEGDPSDPDALFRAMGSRRGVETLFRTSYRVNMDLTSLADSKANIMISINGLMVSILIASIAPKLDSNPWLLTPTIIFLVGCLVSLVFSVLSARPRVHTSHMTLDEIRRSKANILFFGNFASLSPADYQTAMKERMNDSVALYELMITDIYGVGAVLERKYKLLRGAYTAFLSALVIGVAAFIIVFSYAAFFQSGPRIVTPIGVDASTGLPIIAPPVVTP